MNKKIIVGGIIGLIALLVAFVVFVIASSGTNKNNSEVVTGDTKTSACAEAVGEEVMIMKDDTYEPKDLEIKLCTKVTFKNSSSEARWPASNIHPTHGIYPEFDPQEGVEPGSEWSFIFDREGRWKYHDHLQPLIVGTITVTK